jgi:hypothetical protein
MSSSSTITTPPDTTPTITNINNIIKTFYNNVQSPYWNPTSNWNPPSFTPNISNNCNIYNNELRNTNENCLKALINNCNISIENQNNVVNYNNCNSLLNYTKSLVNSNVIKYQNWINDNDKWGPWSCYGSCHGWAQLTLPDQTQCREYSRGQCDCWVGFGKYMSRDKLANCPDIDRIRGYFNNATVAKTALDNITCPSIQMIPTPPINCCNNILNCEFAQCINIIQTCKQTINGETEISNATQCLTSKCPMNDQKCIAGTPGAGTFNWVCQNNKWVRQVPSPTPPISPPPPSTTPQSPPPPSTTPPSPTPPSTTPPSPPPPSTTPPSPTTPSSPTIPSSPPPTTTPSSPPPPTTPSSPTPPPPKPTTNYTLYIIIFIIVIILLIASFYFIR